MHTISQHTLNQQHSSQMVPPPPLSDSAAESGRISFSSEFLDESAFISICPNPQAEREAERARAAEFEFLSGNLSSMMMPAEFEFLSGNLSNMMPADELFSEGKLLPFWEIHQSEKLNRLALKSENSEKIHLSIEQIEKDERRITWFLDDDPSPRPPKCTVLWKELLRLKKQRPSTLSPSNSSSSSSSSSRNSVGDAPLPEVKKDDREKNGEKSGKRIRKLGQERTRSTSIRIRPVLNVPICAQAKNGVLPPLFSLRKGRLER